jgi:hypothetical protein
MNAKLTDTMTVTLAKLARDGYAFANVLTFKALERRGLVTANTAPRDPAKGVWCHYMLTDAGRSQVEQPHYFEFGTRRGVNAGPGLPVQGFDHCKVCDGRVTAPQHLR